MPYIDVTKPWWVPNTADRMSLGGHVYYAISQFDTSHYDSVRTLFFNKQLINDCKLDDPYQLVYDGKWTLDVMLNMGLAAAQDLNGDSVWGDGDRFGFTSYDSMGANVLCSGAGAVISTNKDENDMPIFNMNNAMYQERFEKISRMVNENPGFSNPLGTGANGGDANAFIEGRALFFAEALANIKKLRDMEDDFGILPAPKYDEAQARYYNLGGFPYFQLVPSTNGAVERTGIIVEALAFASLDRIDTVFYEVYLQSKTIRDEDSPKMLDLIFSTLDYNLPLARSHFANKTAQLVWAGNLNFASYFAKIDSAVEAEIEVVEKFLADLKQEN